MTKHILLLITALPIDPDIDNKILSKESEITTAKSFQDIQTKSALASIPVVTVPYDNAIAIAALSQSIDNISEIYLEKFKEHKEHLSMDGKEEEWIKQGYEAMYPLHQPHIAPIKTALHLWRYGRR